MTPISARNIKFALLLSLPVVLMTAIWVVNWRRWHPIATNQDLQMRFTMSQADRVSCVVHKRDAFYETEQIVKVESFSEDDLRSIKDSFNFAGKRHGSKGPNDTPSLYFYFYNKKNRLTAAICLDYAFNPHAYAFYFDKNKKQKNYWLHGTTTFRIRQYVLTNEKLKQALIQCGAKTRDFAPNYAFMGANEH